ncbi:MAG: hypothetical protein RR439_08475 [Carnobacterium sp.]
MALEDKDFIMRQVKQLAEGIGKFLGLESIKELINYDQSEEDILSDDEIEGIILITDVKEIQKKKKLSNKEIAKKLEITENDLNHLYNGERFTTPSELIEIRRFIERNEI